MIQYIKGKNYFINDNPRIITKTKIITKVARLKRRIQRKLFKAANRISRNRNRRNYRRKSYFRRFNLFTRRRLFRRTRYSRFYLKSHYQEETVIFHRLRDNIVSYEEFLRRKRLLKYKYTIQPLSMRRFSLGRVYITNRKRNTFITIEHISVNGNIKTERIIFKTSCGLIGYAGPKRPTKHAREETARVTGLTLAEKQLTSIDIIFNSGTGRKFIPFIRHFLKMPIYVRHLIVPKRRSHGFTRLKKARRT